MYSKKKTDKHTDFLQSHKKEFFAKKRIRDLKKEIKTLTCKIQDNSGKRWLQHDVSALQRELDNCRKTLQSFTSGTAKQEYETLLDRYRECEIITKNDESGVIGTSSVSYNKRALEQELREQIDQKFKCKRNKCDSVPVESINGGDVCENCDCNMNIIMSQALMVCPQCSMTRMYIQNTTQNIAYGTNVIYQNFSYKKKNHFNDNLQCFQAKEIINIPDEVFSQIMDILYRRGIKLKDVTQNIVLKILKELKLRKYYEHMPKITALLTGVYPPRFTLEQESFVKRMFDALQEPFELHKPPDRKNFLSYNYVTLKMVQLCGWDYFLKYLDIRKLKGSDKRLKQDAIFKKCCETLGWEFIESV